MDGMTLVLWIAWRSNVASICGYYPTTCDALWLSKYLLETLLCVGERTGCALLSSRGRREFIPFTSMKRALDVANKAG